MGNIYFIQEAGGGSIKIGYTTLRCDVRLRQIQSHNSNELVLIGEINNAPRTVEREWHLRFADCQKRLEWFWPSRALVTAIDDLMGRAPKPEQRAGQLSHLVIAPIRKPVITSPTDPVAAIIAAWPSLDQLASDMGLPLGVVKQWRNRKSIPGEYWATMHRVAERQGYPITAHDIAAAHASIRPSVAA